MRSLVGVLGLFGFSAFWACGADTPTSVTLPFEHYLQLKRNAEAPSLSTLEQVVLTGQFGKSLSIEFSGASPKKWDKRVIADASDKFSFSHCKGQAHLDRANGKIVLVPTQESFKLTCDLQVTNWASFELVLHNVLSLKTSITGGEVVVTNAEQGQKKVAFAGRSSERGLASDISATGRYRITKLPDGQKFRYEFSLRNPGRAVTPFKISLTNGEAIQQITSEQPHTEAPGAVSLSLNPGNNEIVIEGKFSRNEFAPLLSNAQQYLLLESHPSFRLEVDTATPRVSPNETGLSSTFRNAVAYQLTKASKVRWTAHELELIASLAYSVENASYVYFVPESGNALVEATFVIQNQGAPEIPLNIEGTPTYVEVDGEGEPLYRSGDGSLLLRLPTGQHTVLVQYQSMHAARGLATAFSTPLARPEAVLSNVQLTLGTPVKWRLVYGSSLYRSESEITFYALFFALIAFGLMWGLCRSAKVRSLHAWLLSGVSFGVVFLHSDFLYVLLGTGLVAALIRYRSTLIKAANTKSRALVVSVSVAALGAVVTFLFFAFSPERERTFSRPMLVASGTVSEDDEIEESAPAAEGGLDAEFEAENEAVPLARKSQAVVGSPSSPSYVGLPARIQLPDAPKQVSFEQQLVDKDTPVYARGYFVSNALLQGIAGLLTLIGLYCLYHERRNFRVWLN